MLIFDVLKRQKTRVIDLIEENDCVFIYVPPNLAHVFQPLDLTENGMGKEFINQKFGDGMPTRLLKSLSKAKISTKLILLPTLL